MFDISVRFQIAATLIYLIILIDYVGNKKLPVLSTRLFSTMLFVSGFNLLFDFGTVYTISHMESIPAWINRGAHTMFIGSLNVLVLVMFLYMDKLAKKQTRKMSLSEVLVKIGPVVILSFFVLFGKLYYYNDGKILYSYGPAATTIFIMIAYYMTYIFINTFRYKEMLGKKKRIAFRMGVLIWVIAGIVQSIAPGILTSNLAQVLMVLFLYLAFENPKEYTDEAAACFNQNAFQMMLNERLASKRSFQIINIVLEDHQRINASYGYNCCNHLMSQLADSTKQLFHERVFHTRGNILSIIVTDGSADKKKRIEKNLHILCARLNNPIETEHNAISVRAHLDIIEGHQYAKTVDEMFGIINYMAQRTGASADNTLLYFCDAQTIQKMQRLVTLEFMIQEAIDKDGFEVFYQPIYDVQSGRFLSAEALVRLKDTQTLGFVSPEEFIPIAEKKGMIMELGRIVFTKVLEFSKQKDLSRLGVDYIEVNLSGIQCVDAQLPVQLKNLMKKYDISPSFINLEITETAMVESGDMLLENMHKLRRLGCSFSMDDFGTGYSNLSQMAEVTYDLVKLDKSLIWPCFEEEQKESANAILESVVSMLLRLGVHIVAEGVETKQQVDRLSEMGVTYLQGYYFSRPIPGEDYAAFLKSKQSGDEENE